MDLLGKEHAYTSNFQATTEHGAYQDAARGGVGILQAVQEDVDGGYIKTVRQLIRAEVFSDIFEQAIYLLENGYTAPAASLAGATLENGLRTIAVNKGIQVKKRDGLQAPNQKIADNDIYSKLTQKKVSVWIVIRNNADHGDFDQLNPKDVDEFITGAQSLLADFL